jgi:hypothetical protein
LAWRHRNTDHTKGGHLVEHDFSVDPAVLTGVAAALEQAVTATRLDGVEDIDCRAGTLGHDGLAAALQDFCDRWGHGLAHLTTDGRDLADSLTQTAATYAEADRTARHALQPTAAALAGPTAPGSEVAP